MIFYNDWPIRTSKQITVKANDYSPQGCLLSSIQDEFVKQTPMKSSKIGSWEDGLLFKYYFFDEVPVNTLELNKLEPVKFAAVEKIKFQLKELAEAFGCLFSGYINIPVEGVYRFTLMSHDRSVLSE